MSRTLELMPSAPMTMSASALAPLSNTSRIASPVRLQADETDDPNAIDPGADGRLEHRMQVAAVNVDVGSAEALASLAASSVDLVQRLARVPGPADERVRADARLQRGGALRPSAAAPSSRWR